MSRNYRLNYKIVITLSLLVVGCVVGCNRYVPEGKVVPQEQLSQYNPHNFSKDKQRLATHHIRGEDELIIRAIWNENQGNFQKSSYYYGKLYELTKKDEYLNKQLVTQVTSGDKSHLDKLEAYANSKPTSRETERLLLHAYIEDKKYDKAKRIAEKLVAHSNITADFLITSNLYLVTGEYGKALDILTTVYNKTSNETILLSMVAISVNFMGDIEKSIALLEKHREKNGCSEKICLQLVNIYVQQKRVEKVIELYRELYKSTHKNLYGEKLIESYMIKKETSSAIQLLTSTYHNDPLLYSLYIGEKDYEKADLLAKKLLEKTKHPKWYAEQAIVMYEKASDKEDKRMLKEFTTLFDKAFEQKLQDGLYLNYYGYILIDSEVDIERGVHLVERALSQESENSYYLDSLAWGYYKKNECKRAYPIMQKVVKIEGLKEREIIEHWNKIEAKCK